MQGDMVQSATWLIFYEMEDGRRAFGGGREILII
jgi:hypothetical protein